jgi:hypothetical protein
MSIEMHVFFHGKLPGKAALTRAMKELGFPLSITPSKGSLEQQKGFMPMRLNREETGVEFDVFEGRETIDEVVQDLDVDPRFDRSANFRWGGDEAEMVCGLCAGAALSKLVNGVFFDTEAGTLLTPDEAIGMATEALKSVVKPAAPKQPGTRPADIKRYLKPLLELRSDLVLVGRMLVIRPVRHLLRGVFLDRTSSKHQFRVYQYISPLYAASRESLGYGELRDYEGLDVRDPYFEPRLMDFLARSLDDLGQVRTLGEFAARLSGESEYYSACVDALVLAGEADRASDYVRRAERDDPRWWKSWTESQRALLSRDVESICAEYHVHEAKAAKALKLGDAWDASPFPVELPHSERTTKSADIAFRPLPWIAPPLGLFEDLPTRPGEVRYARGLHWRGLQACLFLPLSGEQATENYRSLAFYMQVVALADAAFLVFGRNPKKRISPPDQAVFEVFLYFYGSAIRVHISADTAEHASEFRIDRVEVKERFTHRGLWTCQVDRDGEKRIWDYRRAPTEFVKTVLASTDLRRFEWPMPPFGEYDDLLHRLRSLLRTEGFGEVV